MKIYHVGFLPFLWIIVHSLNGCSRQEDSSAKGHYENSDEASMEKYRGKQRVIPEYEPVEAVITSVSLLTGYEKLDLIKAILQAGVDKVFLTDKTNPTQTWAGEKFATYRDELGDELKRIEYLPMMNEGPTGPWARDWAPITAKATDGSGELRLLDFNYFPGRKGDDSGALTFAKRLNAPRISLPLYFEGGNFMINHRGDCLMSDSVLEANQEAKEKGDKVLNRPEIEGLFKDFAGCSRVLMFPRMPHEPTGHIDMWAKLLDDDTIIVSEIGEQTLALFKDSPKEMTGAREIQTYLNGRAEELATLGFRVQRVPMPLPHTAFYSSIKTYTNSLLVNKTALIPRYREDLFGLPKDLALMDSYESKVRSAYEAAGYTVVYIEAGVLSSDGGGTVHCVTMQIPKLP